MTATTNFLSIRVITDDVDRLVDFYERAIGTQATRYTPDFAELNTPSCTLAIASARTMTLFGHNAARPADNHTVIIEFLVDDVDADFTPTREPRPGIPQRAHDHGLG